MKNVVLNIIFATLICSNGIKCQTTKLDSLYCDYELLKSHTPTVPLSFWDNISLSNYNLPFKFYDELYSYYLRNTNYEDINYNSPIDSLDGTSAIYFKYELNDSLLIKIIKHSNKNDTRLLELLSDYNPLTPDSFLFHYNYEEGHPGSYRSRRSITWYWENDTTVYVWKNNKKLNSDGYYAFLKIETDNQSKYLCQGGVQGCNTCHSEYVDLIYINKGSIYKDFSIGVSSRDYGSNIITYNTDSIVVRYVQDDLTPDCECDNIIREKNRQKGECFKRYVFDGNIYKLSNCAFYLSTEN